MSRFELLIHFSVVDDPVLLTRTIISLWNEKRKPELFLQSKSELLPVTNEVLNSKLKHGSAQSVAVKLKTSKSKADAIVFEFYFTNPTWNLPKLNFLSVSMPESYIFERKEGFSLDEVFNFFVAISNSAQLKDGYFEHEKIIHDDQVWKINEQFAKLRGPANWPVVPCLLFFVPKTIDQKLKIDGLQVINSRSNGSIARMSTKFESTTDFEEHRKSVITIAQQIADA